jgi:uncharacterized oxidoreductase
LASYHARRRKDDLVNLIGRTILVTGGSAGIGLAFALEFLKRGNVVIVTGRRQSVLDQVTRMYPLLHTIRSDVAEPQDIVALAAEVKSRFPKLDVLINNAGVSRYINLKVPAKNLPDLMEELQINVGGVVRTTSAFIDILGANMGTIINMSSALAFVPLPCIPIYCATKAAIHSYTQSLRFQLEDAGVEVIEIMPPAVKTDMTADLSEGDGLTLITTAKLVRLVFNELRSGKSEILPGASKQLAMMRRVAPNFINRRLWKAGRKYVPAGAA